MFKFIGLILIIGFMIVFLNINLFAVEINNSERHQALAHRFFPNYLFRATDVENKNQTDEPLSMSDKSILDKTLTSIGCIGGCTSGCVTFIVIMIIASESENCYELGCGMWEGLIGGITSHTLGSAISVYIYGSSGNETGSFLATLVGSILGAGMGITGAIIFSEAPPLALTVFLICPPIGATIGFNLTHRYKSPPASKTALINLRSGQMSFAIPTVYSQFDSSDGVTQRVDLMNITF